MKTIILSLMASTLLFGATACNNKRNEGPIERAGKKVDDAVDNVKDGESPFHKKGTVERAGEAVDDAVGNNNDRH